MTAEQQRITISEACGWTILHATWAGIPPNAEEDCRTEFDLVPLPQYPLDRNAICAAVEHMICLHGWNFQQPYIECLKLIIKRRRKGMNEAQSLFWLSEATAQQRCEAFIDALAIMKTVKELP